MDTEQKSINSGFGWHTTAEEIMAGVDLSGKIAIVTGGHSGIGVETTRVLSNAGATVIVGARDLKKAGATLAGMKNVEIVHLDLADPNSVDQFAETFLSSNRPLDLLINNAGTMAIPELTKDKRGCELQFGTNHLGHFQLTARVWESLKKTGNARVISLSSFGHRASGVNLDDPNFTARPYEKMVAYGQSKSANSLFAVELDERGKEYGIRTFAVHPGAILTDLIRHTSDEDLKPWGVLRENGVLKGPDSVFKSVAQGAATSVWCAVSPQLEGKGGVYCADCNISKIVPDDDMQTQAGVRSWAIDKPTAKALWELSEQLTSL